MGSSSGHQRRLSKGGWPKIYGTCTQWPITSKRISFKSLDGHLLFWGTDSTRCVKKVMAKWIPKNVDIRETIVFVSLSFKSQKGASGLSSTHFPKDSIWIEVFRVLSPLPLPSRMFTSDIPMLAYSHLLCLSLTTQFCSRHTKLTVSPANF